MFFKFAINPNAKKAQDGRLVGSTWWRDVGMSARTSPVPQRTSLPENVSRARSLEVGPWLSKAHQAQGGGVG